MSEKIHVYDLTIFGDRIYKIQRALFMLDIFVQIKDERNGLQINKQAIATVLKKSYRSVSYWIEILAKNGAIKYRYSGSACLNPFFAFDGNAEQYAAAVELWYSFKSDIPALKKRIYATPGMNIRSKHK